jgi:hypothetical protein
MASFFCDGHDTSGNYGVSGFCPLSGNINTRKNNVSETGSISIP